MAAADLPGRGAYDSAASGRGTAARTAERLAVPGRQSHLKVELHRGARLLASWQAASGIAGRQSVDRRWSPGNASLRLPACTAWGVRNRGEMICGLT